MRRDRDTKGAHIFAPFPGRLMKEYVAMPEAIIGNGKELKGWLRRSLEYAAALPPKGAKKGPPRVAKKSATKKTPLKKNPAKKTPASRSRAAK